MKKYTWDTNLKIRLIGEGIFNLLYWMYFPFIAIYFSDELGLAATGILMSIPPFISMLGNIVGGTLADRIGRRRLMLIGSAIQAIMFLFFALSDSVWLNYLAFLGLGLGGALYGPASDAMVADLVPNFERKKVFASFITVNNLGAVIGPILGAILFFQYRSPLLWLCAAITFVYFIVIFIRIKETNPKREVNKSISINVTDSIESEFKDMTVVFRDKIFLLYILAGIFSVIAIMQLDLYLAIYITEFIPTQTIMDWKNFSLSLSSNEVFGWMLSLNGLLFVLFVIPVTSWLKNWHDKNVFILSCVLAGIGMFAVGFTENFWLLLFFTIVFTFGEIVRSPVINNFVSQYAPQNKRGQYMGASRLQYTIGRFLAPLTIILSSWYSPLFIFSLILISAFISMLIYIKLYKISTLTPENSYE